jgi:hypothetical protein
MTIIDEIICVCCKKDIETWKVSSNFIAQNINAKTYTVIVPDDEAKLFSVNSDPTFRILPESRYLKISKSWLAENLPINKKKHAGWYLQQFIKISVAKNGEENNLRLIWDADTIPVKKINFLSENGKLIYYKGSEHHKPYFYTIEKLLGLKRFVDFSFISQCMILRSNWVKRMCNEIESKNSQNWIDSILNSLDSSEQQGFSEYETLGTYFFNHYSSEISITDRKWHRYGGSMIGNACSLSNIKASQISTRYDYVTFESWEK